MYCSAMLSSYCDHFRKQAVHGSQMFQQTFEYEKSGRRRRHATHHMEENHVPP